MKNEERQRRLDEAKWIASEMEDIDMGGKMWYCSRCEYNEGGSCEASESKRVNERLCAMAYNRGRKNG